MARTLLITFPSNSDAERFCTILDQLQTKRYEGLTDEGITELGDLLLDGDDLPQMDALVARPTLACRGHSRTQRTKVGFVQMPRFGWLVCAQCKRPTVYVVKHFISNRIMGLNDLLAEVIGGRPVKEHLDAETVDQLQRRESVSAP